MENDFVVVVFLRGFTGEIEALEGMELGRS